MLVLSIDPTDFPTLFRQTEFSDGMASMVVIAAARPRKRSVLPRGAMY